MKKIILSSVMALALLVSATTLTYAVFSDSKSMEDNTIATATVDIDFDDETPLGKPINEMNMVPGEWSDLGRLGVFNKSSVPLKAYFYVTNLEGECDKTWIEIRTGWAGGDEDQFLIYEGYLNGIKGPGNRQEITALGLDPAFMNPAIPAGWTQVTWQKAKLHESAGNSYINTYCTWEEVFVGETLLP